MINPENSPILKQNSTLAIVSFISGLTFFIGLPIVGSVIAVITGNRAMKEINNSNGMLIGENFARIGIITGWFGLGVWALGIICGFLGIISGVCVASGPILSELLKFFQR